MNKFQNWAEEINKDWSAGYNATATEEALTVAFEGKEVAKVDSRFNVTGEDTEAVEQLNYMVNR